MTDEKSEIVIAQNVTRFSELKEGDRISVEAKDRSGIDCVIVKIWPTLDCAHVRVLGLSDAELLIRSDNEWQLTIHMSDNIKGADVFLIVT